MRNMSFALTVPQFLARTKTVTRRLRWEDVEPGEVIAGCRKCMGLPPGERIERLGLIVATEVNRQPIRVGDDDEAAREGFPGMRWPHFVELLCDAYRVPSTEPITRIRFAYIVGGRFHA